MSAPGTDGGAMHRGATIENPVIRGFAPDPSIIRVGEWYYCATSSFEWFPTIPIHRSRDLARWEHLGHVEGAVPGDSLAGYPDSGGIWAPALSHDGDEFWMTYAIVESVRQPYFNLGVYITRAPTTDDGPGAWSTPVRVSSTGFDPSLFHHEGRHWLANIQNDHRPGGRRFDGIVLTELDVSGPVVTTTGPTTLLLQRENLIEGPKLVARDGWFHLLLAEGGTGTEHGVLAARSRELTGPYTVDAVPLMTTRDDLDQPLQKAGHGELIETPAGEWYLGHLASRPVRTPRGDVNPLGRETAIQRIVWNEDGRPRLANGTWHPDVRVEGIALAEEAPPLERTGAAPDPLLPSWPWSTLRAPASADWIDLRTRPGWIRLRGRQGPESLRRHSLLGQRLTELDSDVSVTVDAHPTHFAHSAGLVLWYNTTSYVTLHLTWSEPEGEAQQGQQWRGRGRTALVLTARDPEGARILAQRPAGAGEQWTLSVRHRGATAQFLAGPARSTLEPLGPEVDVAHLSDDYPGLLRFTGVFAAISVHDLVDEEFSADFADFTVRSTARALGHA